MSKQNQPEPKDIYTICKQNMNKFFEDWQKSLSQYQESASSLQREYLQSCKKICDSVLSSQQEYANSFGITTNLPESFEKIIKDSADATGKIYSIQNQAYQTTIDTTVHNVKALNDNSKSFADLNKSINQIWSPLLQKE